MAGLCFSQISFAGSVTTNNVRFHGPNLVVAIEQTAKNAAGVIDTTIVDLSNAKWSMLGNAATVGLPLRYSITSTDSMQITIEAIDDVDGTTLTDSGDALADLVTVGNTTNMVILAEFARVFRVIIENVDETAQLYKIRLTSQGK